MTIRQVLSTRFQRLEIGLAALCAVSPLAMIVLDSCRTATDMAEACLASPDRYETGIRAAISHYWDMPAAVAYYVPLTVAVMLFLVNGALKKKYEYNIILGGALLLLVIFNHEQFYMPHMLGVFVFFVGSVVVLLRAFTKGVIKVGVLAAALAFFFVIGNLIDADWTENWILWLEWSSLLVIATHFVLVAWLPDESYEDAPVLPKQHKEAMKRHQQRSKS